MFPVVRSTLRQNTTRKEIGANGQEQESANRRVFYDFTISPPKSVSIAAFAGNDSRLVEGHEQAVTMALNQLQNQTARRPSARPVGRKLYVRGLARAQ
jgi:conjugative relaxase-like TrwC/TraI family protein